MSGFKHGSSDEPTTLADLAAERQLIAVILAESSVMERMPLRPEDFFDPIHRELWAAMREISGRGEALSVAVLAAALPQSQRYVARFPDVPARLDSADSYAATIRDFAARRRIVALSDELRERAGDVTRPAQEIASDAVQTLSKLELGRQAQSKRAVAQQIYDALSAPQEMFSTGFPRLDMAMGGGLSSGQLFGFGARKKVGKTILLGSISHNLNAARVPHLFLTLEMSAVEIERRNIGRQMGFNAVRFLRPDREKLRGAVGEYAATINDASLFEHAPGATFDEVRGIIARAQLRGIKGVILDYLQLVEGKAKGETEEYHHRRVAQWLADTGRKTGLWVITACQLNQDDNVRGGEGLKLACDQYYLLHREKDQPGAWLEMQESRHTLYRNVGSETLPELWLRKYGPHFSEEVPRAREWDDSAGAA